MSLNANAKPFNPKAPGSGGNSPGGPSTTTLKPMAPAVPGAKNPSGQKPTPATPGAVASKPKEKEKGSETNNNNNTESPSSTTNPSIPQTVVTPPVNKKKTPPKSAQPTPQSPTSPPKGSLNAAAPEFVPKRKIAVADPSKKPVAPLIGPGDTRPDYHQRTPSFDLSNPTTPTVRTPGTTPRTDLKVSPRETISSHTTIVATSTNTNTTTATATATSPKPTQAGDFSNAQPPKDAPQGKTPPQQPPSSPTTEGDKPASKAFRARGPEVKIEAVPKPENRMPLANPWCLYCHSPAVESSGTEFKPPCLVTVDDVEGMWGVIHHAPKPSTLHIGSSYYFFRQGIEPKWEAPDNETGGQWILMVKHEDVRARGPIMDTLWEEYVMAVLGESLDGGKKNINGIVCKARPKQFVFYVWTRSSQSDLVRPIGEELRKLLTESCPELRSTGSNNLEFYLHNQLEGASKKGAYSRPQPMMTV
eukprot:PhF_6_TR39694/c2_g1_i1/m.59004/K03259/EIF4E; translation initiation factor 4E